MSQVEPVVEPWDGRQTGLRLALRLIGVTGGAYLLVTAGVLDGPLWLTTLTGIAVATMYVLVFLRRRPFDGWAMGLTLLMMLSAAVAAPFLNFIPLYFVVVGGVILVSQPSVPLSRSVPLAVAVGVVLAGSVILAGQSGAALLASVLGFAAVALFGANRRQQRFRERQDRELVLRSRELEQRSQQLIAQTERTQQETARAAALAERGRIARDIHDVLAHSLGGLVVQLDAAEALLTEGADPAAAAERLRASRQLAVEGLRDARLAVQELREPDDSAESGDLVAEILTLTHGPVAQQLGLDVDVAGQPYSVPTSVVRAFTAVGRESITNVNKHATGQRATLSLVFEPDRLVLETVNAIPSTGSGALAQTGSGLGLAGMRSRMADVGGRLESSRQGERWVTRAEWERP
ncbi:MAG: histidine kinase [Propionibacteriaceae bacterium]